MSYYFIVYGYPQHHYGIITLSKWEAVKDKEFHCGQLYRWAQTDLFTWDRLAIQFDFLDHIGGVGSELVPSIRSSFSTQVDTQRKVIEEHPCLTTVGHIIIIKELTYQGITFFFLQIKNHIPPGGGRAKTPWCHLYYLLLLLVGYKL